MLTGVASSRAPFTDAVDSQTNRHGSDNCTIPIGGSTCSKTVSFSPVFPQVPFFAQASTTQTPPTFTFNATMWTIPFFSLTSTGQTWVSMPAAQTEVFGDTSFQHVISPITKVVSGAPVTVSLGMTCTTASTSATAVLQAQYSPDAVTWANIGGQLSISSCPNVLVSVPATLPSAAQCDQVLVLCFYRLTGIHGNGVGDNPVLTSAFLEFFTNSLTVNNNIQVIPTSVLNVNTMTWQAQTQYAVSVALTVVFLWKVDGCTDSLSSC